MLDDRDLGKIEKRMKTVFIEGFEQLVLPRFDEVMNELKDHRERLEVLEEGQGRMEFMLQRVVRDVDDHSVRMTKIEKKVFGT